LVVAGEWLAARSDVRTLRRAGTTVQFIPRYLDDDELAWLLSHAEAVLLPYVTASQSGVLPVALRLARHVVVSDAGGLLEGVPAAEGSRSSVTAVAAGEVTALAAAIAGLVTRGRGREAGPRNGASRHVAASISAIERRESWMPFVSALQGLVSEVGPWPVSNSEVRGSSELSWKFRTVSPPPARGTMPGARRAE